MESHYFLRPSIRTLLVTFFVHHNPFYLLSALCMVAGCYALNSDLGTRTGEWPKLLALIGTLNVYELILIALGIYLIRRRGVIRDGRTLLLLEAPLLVDLAFLNAEVASLSFRIGLIINLALLALALAKIAIIVRGLSGRWMNRGAVFILLQLGMLFLLPSVFKHLEHGMSPTADQFYAAWWAAGMLLVAGHLLSRRSDRLPMTESRVWTTMRRVYSTLPFLAILAHLGMLHWVYGVRFYCSDVAPVLLGLTVVLALVRPLHPERRAWINLIRVGMLCAAIGTSLWDPAPLHVSLTSRFGLTPIALTTAAAYLVFIYCYLRPYTAFFVFVGALSAGLYLFGPTVQAIVDFISAIRTRLVLFVERMMPRTAAQWGILAMGSAFAFLGLGAAVSLRKPPAVDPPTPGGGN